MRKVLLAAVLVAACTRHSKDEPAARGSGTARAPAVPCDQAELEKRVQAGFDGTARYFGEIEKRISGWSDCEVARKDLLAIEPAAKAYVDLVSEQREWMTKAGPACVEQLAKLGDARAKANGMAERFTPMLKQLKDVVQRCHDTPGFLEAEKKGIKLLKKQK